MVEFEGIVKRMTTAQKYDQQGESQVLLTLVLESELLGSEGKLLSELATLQRGVRVKVTLTK